jgi:hypothetical protein
MSDIVERLRERPWRHGGETEIGAKERRQREREEAADEITRLTARVAELEGALAVCDRVLHFDLRRMIEWGDDYNQAVKDAADKARAALSPAITKDTA